MNYPDSICDRPPGPTTLGQRGRTEDPFLYAVNKNPRRNLCYGVAYPEFDRNITFSLWISRISLSFSSFELFIVDIWLNKSSLMFKISASSFAFICASVWALWHNWLLEIIEMLFEKIWVENMDNMCTTIHYVHRNHGMLQIVESKPLMCTYFGNRVIKGSGQGTNTWPICFVVWRTAPGTPDVLHF